MSDIGRLEINRPKKPISRKKHKAHAAVPSTSRSPSKDTTEKLRHYQQLLKGMAEEQARFQENLKELEFGRPESVEQLSRHYEALQSARDELAVAEEQLRRQNDELHALLKSVEKERLRYEKLFEFIPGGHIVTDGSGIIREASSQAALLLNASWQMLVGKPLIVFFAKADRKFFHKHLLSLKRGTQVLGWEAVLQPRKKASLPASVIAAPFFEDNDVKLHWLISDISKRIKIQDELLQKTALFERVVNCSPLGIIAFDNECRYTLWNPALEEMTGVRQEDVLGNCAFDVFSFLKESGEYRNYLETLAGKTLTVENRMYRSLSTGRVRYFDAQYSPLRDKSGEVIGGFVFIRDTTKKKQIEEALRQSEEKYRNLFENSLLGIFTLDLKGRYTTLNPAAQRIHGCSLEEIIGRSYKERVAPKAVEYLFGEYNKVFRTGNPASNIQYDIITKSGELKTLESNVAVLMAEGRTVGFQATALDITERKLAEDSLRLTNLLLQVANRHSQMGPLLDDLLRIIQEFFHCEAVGIRVYGAGQQIINQKSIGFPGEFFESNCQLSYRPECCFCGEGEEAAAVVNGPDSSSPCKKLGYKLLVALPIRVEQRQVGIIQVADRSEQGFKERTLKVLEQAVSHIGTSIVRIQMNETVRQALQVSHQKSSETSALLESLRAVLEYQKFSKAAETIISSCRRLIGAAAGYITIKNDDEDYEEVVVLSSDGAPPGLKSGSRFSVRGLRAAAYNSSRSFYNNNPSPAEQGEMLPKRISGRNFLVSPVLLDDQAAGLMVFFNKQDSFSDEDLGLVEAFAGQAAMALRNSMYLEALQKSEARYRWLSEGLEATVRKKLAELQQARALATIGQMVSVVAHEIRNPLQNIYMGVDSLRKEIDPAKAEILDEISYGVGMLNAIVRELLDYSKPVTLVFSSRTAGDIIRHSLNMLSDRLAQVKVRKVLKSSEKKIVVDAEKISRVLVNLITNAVEAMPNGGELTISSEFCMFEGAYCLKLSVSDTGCGIDKENLARIEEPFFTTKTQGTGLGISICKKIVAAHNGDIRIRSRKGEGTTVDVFLPSQVESQEQEA